MPYVLIGVMMDLYTWLITCQKMLLKTKILVNKQLKLMPELKQASKLPITTTISYITKVIMFTY